MRKHTPTQCTQAQDIVLGLIAGNPSKRRTTIRTNALARLRNHVTHATAAVDKDTKMLQRTASLVKPHTESKLVHDDGTVVSETVEAKCGYKTSDGEVLYLVGLAMSFGFGNCALLGWGSGKAALDPCLNFVVTCPMKTVVKLPIASSTAEKAIAIAQERTAIADLAGGYGDVLVDFDEKPRAKFTVFGAEWARTGEPEWSYDEKACLVTVTVPGKWTGVSKRQKVASDGEKASLSPEVVYLFDAVSGKPIPVPNKLLNGETRKGAQMFYESTAQRLAAQGEEFVIDVGAGGITPDQLALVGEDIKANSRLVKVAVRVSNAGYEYFKAVYRKDKAYTFLANNYVVWEGTMYFGTNVSAVEYSPTEQGVSNTELIGEMLLAVAAVTPDFPMDLWNAKAAKKRRGALHGLLRMAHNAPVKEEKAVLAGDLSVEAARFLHVPEITADELKEVLPDLRGYTTDRELLKAVCEHFPEMVLSHGTHKQYLDVDAMLSLGAFAGDDEGYAFVGELTDLLRYLALETKHGDPTQTIARHFRMFKRQLKKTLVDSRKTLARLMRTGRLHTRKIDTTFRFGVEPFELHINPKDPVCKGKGGLKHGDTLLLSRIPVFFVAPVRVVYDEFTPIGVFQVDPLYWHALNEGDSDGDSCAILRVPADKAEAVWEAFQNPENGAFSYHSYFTLRGVASLW